MTAIVVDRSIIIVRRGYKSAPRSIVSRSRPYRTVEGARSRIDRQNRTLKKFQFAVVDLRCAVRYGALTYRYDGLNKISTVDANSHAPQSRPSKVKTRFPDDRAKALGGTPISR